MDSLYARQSIVDSHRRVQGFELFFRPPNSATAFDTKHATATILVNLMNQFGLGSFEGKKIFININPKILHSNILGLLPKEHVVFELSHEMHLNASLLNTIRDLHRQGYHFALDNVTPEIAYIENIRSVLEYMDYAKFDASLHIERLEEVLHYFSHMTKMAHKIETGTQFHTFVMMGFSLFQGNLFETPQLISKPGKIPDFKIISELYQMMLLQKPLGSIVETFEKCEVLQEQLEHFYTMQSPGRMKPRPSLSDMLEELGRDRVTQWLLMLIYAKSGKTSQS